ncbi:hypothetical protein [Rhizorhabdus sp.]|uniref:hypothetical protein n=1 Tax=Rhizorhabdus sp. TaxID=1968843 RepID=UPI0019C0F92A|nr:hypothetical protein [Rhizorhabdus sp.]MBD3762601.1 hypothetical protein [Rhizorhabdus sp.]
MNEDQDAPRGADVPLGVDRLVPPTDKFDGMTVIVRDGRTFAIAGVGEEASRLVESFATQQLAIAADRAANPDWVNFCRAQKDGECSWAGCPQLRDGEPARSSRHCPLDEGCPRCCRAEEECIC